MQRISHPDGTTETFTYNVYGQVLSHTDGKGQTTRLMRTARGLPSSRQDAKAYGFGTSTTRPFSLQVCFKFTWLD
ncbi:hypothetical protein ABGT18_08990 [Pseudomonas putida]|uniref:YD repeat-containing protein n=1 Tax=Pseudomonas putida TaxID=303 RepID=A0A2S3XBV3_PSEPU|nr:hypothetical protein [Pseudomonas putida]MCG3646366.1 hypothetical protein [Pseudomonas putida]POF93635.1 hypothetical protein BGP83_13375 [Pseudomonas putida]POF96737.1 hypothetical protein BGP81_08380 [Pseudomonas putida]POG13001.1 hypothetical protein BGP82_00660 [Pseudomonas putida]WRW01356.1 hypothetical protein VPZ82_16480 [Pseudomonas putida]